MKANMFRWTLLLACLTFCASTATAQQVPDPAFSPAPGEGGEWAKASIRAVDFFRRAIYQPWYVSACEAGSRLWIGMLSDPAGRDPFSSLDDVTLWLSAAEGAAVSDEPWWLTLVLMAGQDPSDKGVLGGGILGSHDSDHMEALIFQSEELKKNEVRRFWRMDDQERRELRRKREDIRFLKDDYPLRWYPDPSLRWERVHGSIGPG